MIFRADMERVHPPSIWTLGILFLQINWLENEVLSSSPLVPSSEWVDVCSLLLTCHHNMLLKHSCSLWFIISTYKYITIILFEKWSALCMYCFIAVYLKLMMTLWQNIPQLYCRTLYTTNNGNVIQGVFKKRLNFLNSVLTNTERALQLSRAPSIRFWEQIAVCPISLWALVVKLHLLIWACAQPVRQISDKVTVVWKWRPFNVVLSLGNRKKSAGAKSRE